MINEELNEISTEAINSADLKSKLQAILQRSDIDSFFAKMEVHLLRMFTPEFLHSNVRAQHGDSDN